jgi:hypothetical protein
MSIHPYSNAEPWRLWRRAVSAPPQGDVDPLIEFPFRITPSDRIVTAGSCFAQHIARHLRERGFNYFVTEPAHPVLDAETAELFNYGVYSARYGNIYSVRQLLQLFLRSHGEFTPCEPAWAGGGAFFDPFRPQIQPDGFATFEEFTVDRTQHLAAVRRAFAELDVFIFTLGLTECWESRQDGAVFPICPGVSAGSFDPDQYRLRNTSVEENVADLRQFVTALRAVNPAARIMLTVSPVPLVATAEAQHVLVATTYSKSVLRVAADVVCRSEDVAYFPSYEIITGPHARGLYFAQDCRSVTESGVRHVMRCFFRHATAASAAELQPGATTETSHLPDPGQAAVQAICEEESLDPAGS